MKRLLIAVVIFGAASNAMASRWVNVARSDVAVIDLDMDTLRSIGDERVVWTRTTPISGELKFADGDSYDEEMDRSHFNCATDTAYATSVTYRLNGAVVFSQQRTNTFDIAPGTVAESEERAVCR